MTQQRIGKVTRAESEGKRRRPAVRRQKSRTARLKELIALATIDCYNESEEATGLFTMMEENLSLPFTATVLGMQVNVEKVDIDNRDTIVAVCVHGRIRQPFRILDIQLSDPPPKGAEWIEAYRLWHNRG